MVPCPDQEPIILEVDTTAPPKTEGGAGDLAMVLQGPPPLCIEATGAAGEFEETEEPAPKRPKVV